MFTGCKERQTENGTRTLIAYGEGIGASAFYTDSKKLKDVVLDPKRKYPFRAVIKVVRYGTMYGFKFFPPNTPITQEDRDNFEYYKRNKYKKNGSSSNLVVISFLFQLSSSFLILLKVVDMFAF